MAGFIDLELETTYTSAVEDIVDDLFVPALKNSVSYDRSAGYFSIEALDVLADGLVPYILNHGKIRLITSVNLDLKELKVIDRGYEIAQETLIEEIEKIINESLQTDPHALKNLDIISNLIAAGILQIKVAFRKDGQLFHDKVAIFQDALGNKISAVGSANATYSAYRKNIETVSVQVASDGLKFEKGIKKLEDNFDAIWNNRHDTVLSFDLPEAACNNLFSKYKVSGSINEAIGVVEESLSLKVDSSNGISLYSYQKEAIRQFIENNYCHLFEMATGTGKTYTAVKAIEYMEQHDVDAPLMVFIVVPQIDLQVQWCNSLKKNNYDAFVFGGTAAPNSLNPTLNRMVIKHGLMQEMAIAVCVYDTFFSKLFPLIKKFEAHSLLVVDEVHGLSNNQVAMLGDNFKYRLGLSATPERYNQEETDKILKYFTQGIPPFKYTIEEAIENGFLSHYEYHPISVYISEEEFETYQKFSKQISIIMNQPKKEQDLKKLNDLLILRSSVIKKASCKLDKLRLMIMEPEHYNFDNSVVYCGHGNDPNDSSEKIVDAVSKSLYGLGGYKVSQYTSATDDRHKVLDEFERGYYQTLVAIKCFDEGVDVPKLDKIYIMASDAHVRQTIQRRGRVLRKCKETGKEVAHIFDMVCFPPENVQIQGGESLVKNELIRVREYGRLANNKKKIDGWIDSILQKYEIEGEDE